MRKRTRIETDKAFTTDALGIAARYGVGEATARKIGAAAGAKVKLGTRTLYLVSKIDDYITKQACKG